MDTSLLSPFGSVKEQLSLAACELPRPLLHPLCCFSFPFLSSRLSSPGNGIWSRAYNKSVNYLSDLPQCATSCTAQSSCHAPPVRPVRSDGARSGFSASTANTPEQKSGQAENKAASLICGEWKVLNGRQSFEVFLTKKKRKKRTGEPDVSGVSQFQPSFPLFKLL